MASGMSFDEGVFLEGISRIDINGLPYDPVARAAERMREGCYVDMRDRGIDERIVCGNPCQGVSQPGAETTMEQYFDKARI